MLIVTNLDKIHTDLVIMNGLDEWNVIFHEQFNEILDYNIQFGLFYISLMKSIHVFLLRIQTDLHRVIVNRHWFNDRNNFNMSWRSGVDEAIQSGLSHSDDINSIFHALGMNVNNWRKCQYCLYRHWNGLLSNRKRIGAIDIHEKSQYLLLIYNVL